MTEMHSHIAALCTRDAWDLLGKKERSPRETIDMIHRAHAACYHISAVGSATHIARCEWLLSTVYAEAAMGHDALLHAQNAAAICRSAHLRGSTLALCLATIARAYDMLGEPVNAARSRQEALWMCEEIEEDEERERAIEETKRASGGPLF